MLYNYDMQRSGFTLIELSVVLVIVSLIVAGVTVGQDLYESAKLRKVISTKESYVLAINSFRLKYDCLPGDCRQASTFFLQQPECTPGAWNSLGCAAINGNGDRRITTGGPVEHYPLWHQLGEAELVGERYCGKGVNGLSGDMRMGLNLPQSQQFKGAAYAIYHRGILSGDFNYYDGNYGHVLLLGGPREGKLPILAGLTNQQAWAIDMKIDDEMPGTGMLRTMKPAFHTPNCGTTTNPETSKYRLNNSSVACSIMFTRIF